MNKKKIIFLFSTIFIFSGLILPILATNASPIDFGFPKREEVTGLGDYIAQFYVFSLAIAGMLALGAIIVGAIQYIVSAGNAAKQSDARDRIFQALLGLGLLFGAYLILYTISPGLVDLRDPHITPVALPDPPPPPPDKYQRIGGGYEEYKWVKEPFDKCPEGGDLVDSKWCDKKAIPGPLLDYDCCAYGFISPY